jgi:hypothetical protein
VEAVRKRPTEDQEAAPVARVFFFLLYREATLPLRVSASIASFHLIIYLPIFFSLLLDKTPSYQVYKQRRQRQFIKTKKNVIIYKIIIKMYLLLRNINVFLNKIAFIISQIS